MSRRRNTRISEDALQFDPEIVRRLMQQTRTAFYDDPVRGTTAQSPMLDALEAAWNCELTVLQRKYLLHYYQDRMTMKQIAVLYGLQPSTVCRTLARGRKRLRRVLQYYIR